MIYYAIKSAEIVAEIYLLLLNNEVIDNGGICLLCMEGERISEGFSEGI